MDPLNGHQRYGRPRAGLDLLVALMHRWGQGHNLDLALDTEVCTSFKI